MPLIGGARPKQVLKSKTERTIPMPYYSYKIRGVESPKHYYKNRDNKSRKEAYNKALEEYKRTKEYNKKYGLK